MNDWANHWRLAEKEVTDVKELPARRFVVTRIDLNKCGHAVEPDFDLVRGLKHLAWLNLFEVPIGNDAVAHLKDLKGLAVLSLQRTRFGADGMPHLKGLTNLTTLILNDTGITDDSLRHLADLAHLRTFHVTGTGLTGTGFALARLPNLRDLNMHLTRLSADGLRAVAALPALAELQLYKSPVRDEWLPPLAESASLETLVLSGNPAITDAGLLAAVAGGRLKRVAVAETRVTADGVAAAKEKSPRTRIEWDGGVR
jgi:hypothetical protein